MNGGMDELYREVILDHHRRPRGRDPLSKPADARAEGKNPSSTPAAADERQECADGYDGKLGLPTGVEIMRSV